jgi:glycosyltransferase involved in cell wall biosynthesis
MSNSKPGLIIFYDHFYPAYKAGGPIQSLTNLVLNLQDTYSISVICSAYDLNDDTMPEGIEVDKWTTVKLPGSPHEISTWYAGKNKMGMSSVKEAVSTAVPGIIYLNGMFSYTYVLVPLMLFRKNKIVICPRGMLQKGALAGKALKKKIYLGLLKISGFCSRVSWHATNEEEKHDIARIFGQRSRITVAGNIPVKPLEKIVIPEKEEGKLRLVYLSLITEKKNLLRLINIIAASKAGITLDIYGPVKDEAYWASCQESIKMNPGKINYRGDVKPEVVQQVFSKYDASILLTKGENFGHALYESLSAGRPVITSHFTPWNQLNEKRAGWNADIADDSSIEQLLEKLAGMKAGNFKEYCTGAHALAKQYYLNGFDVNIYKKIFS